MGKIAIIECCNNSKSAKEGKSTIAHLKNNKIISAYINCEYCITEDDLIDAAQTHWDTLIFTAASPFAKHDLIKEIIHNNENSRKIFLNNDYHLTPHSELKKYDYEIISNYEKSDGKHRQYMVNLNALFAQNPLPLIRKEYDCLYYGAYRVGRIKSFKEYLKSEIYLSTTSRGLKGFKEMGCNPILTQQIDWSRSITNLFRYSLYIEDEWIHNNFHNLANRWYEAGKYNNVMFFDCACANTIMKSEIADVFDEYYFVDCYEDLLRKIKECNKDFTKHLAIQREWHKRDFEAKEQCLRKIKSIIDGAE